MVKKCKNGPHFCQNFCEKIPEKNVQELQDKTYARSQIDWMINKTLANKALRLCIISYFFYFPVYNHFDNMQRFLMFYQLLPSPKVKLCAIIGNKQGT